MRIVVENVDIKTILFSGACFRAILESDGSVTNVLKDRVVNIKQDNNILYVKSNNYDKLEEIIIDYFDLNRNYHLINEHLINNNLELKDVINSCINYRILNQDSFEMCVSYIISQNNNVKRISNSISMLCEKYGSKVIFDNKEYYLFPTYEQLKNITLEELRNLGVGFRDKYLRDYLDKYETLSDLNELSTEVALNKLMSVKGIGLKVASCILLFGYRRLDVFPIDTWVKKYMIDNYGLSDNINEIETFSKNKFGEYSGLVIQYMFHSKRNI